MINRKYISRGLCGRSVRLLAIPRWPFITEAKCQKSVAKEEHLDLLNATQFGLRLGFLIIVPLAQFILVHLQYLISRCDRLHTPIIIRILYSPHSSFQEYKIPILLDT